MACQGATRGDRTTPLRNDTGTRAPVTVSWEQGSWDKTFSSSPIHSPCVGLCDPGAPCTWASPRGKRNEKDLELRAAPREFPGSRAAPPCRAGKGRHRCGWLREGWSSTGPVGTSRASAPCEGPGRSSFVPASAVVPFPSSVVVSKARCE